MSVQLIVDNPNPSSPVDLYAHWEDEPHWHDSEQAEAFGWAAIAAFGIACFFAGCLVTAALALIVNFAR